MIRQDYTHENITATSTGVTELGPVNIHRFGGTVFAKAVTARQDGATDAAFNVNLDGNAIFANSQQVSASNTFETFTPDQNRRASGDNVSLEADVQTAAGSSGPILMGVLLETEDEQS